MTRRRPSNRNYTEHTNRSDMANRDAALVAAEHRVRELEAELRRLRE